MSHLPHPSEPHRAQDQSIERDLDAAQQSLGEALRVSFWILKLSMLLLLGLYLLSGIFSVSEQEKAVRLRFGTLVGQPGQKVLEPGGPYFSLPYPFEQVITVPVSPQQVNLDTEFWYEADPRVAANAQGGKAGPLNPAKDGSLLTADAEIIHARWSVTYTVTDPIRYLANVGDPARARALVRNIAQQGIVFAAAGITADQLIRSQDVSRARLRAQAILDALDSGIKITNLSVKDPVYPLPVRRAVQAVLNAESVNAKLIEEAQEQWGRILVQTAGEAYQPLLMRIEAYELASQIGDTQRLDQLDAQMDEEFANLAIKTEQGLVSIGGSVTELIHEAMTYRTEVVTRVRGDAEYFSSLLPQYRSNPRIVVNRLWQDAKERILTGDIETLYLPRGQTYLELNRDPKIQQERERKKLTDEDQSQRSKR